MSGDDSALAREGEYLHRLFFRCAIPDVVIQRYVAANRACFPEIPPADASLLQTIVNRRLDAEAIELALRIKGRECILTRKIQVLFYLVEVRSAYRGYFMGGSEPHAFTSVATALVSTVWKAAKGRYLLWRHGLG